jgi:hypothetical protein
VIDNSSLQIGYFLLGDSLNTTVTVIATLQNSIVAYNTLQLTYLLIVGIAAQVSAFSWIIALLRFTSLIIHDFRRSESTHFGTFRSAST